VTAYDYRFATVWRVPSSPERVSEILEDPCGLPGWWPEVYLKVCKIDTGVYSFLTKGWLPYRLLWYAKERESRHPYGFSVDAWGDLEGTGVWTFKPEGDWTLARFDWSVSARKPLLRYLSPVLKRLFRANHRWAMRRGEAAIKNELARKS
jgi:hypothetical protein